MRKSSASATIALRILIEAIEVLWDRAIGVGGRIEWVAVESVGNRLALSHHLLQMQGRDMVVVVVGAATVTAVLIEFPDEI